VQPLKVLSLTKKSDPRSERARDHLCCAGAEVQAHAGGWGSSFPVEWWSGEVIISYLSRWIVPGALLRKAQLAINFHPAPPQYPGIGGVNWALYEGVSEFGVTCHKMVSRVDAGPIIATKRFPIFPTDTVASLSERSLDHLLVLFYEVAQMILARGPLPAPAVSWSGRTRTRVELNELSTITLGMDEQEVLRRVRATHCGKHAATLVVGGSRFRLLPDQ
jgi:methionyl-tRNA formyltransferase